MTNVVPLRPLTIDREGASPRLTPTEFGLAQDSATTFLTLALPAIRAAQRARSYGIVRFPEQDAVLDALEKLARVAQ